MPAAILVPAIIGAASAAGQIYSANRAVGAQKDAAKAQTDATNKAIALQQQADAAQQGRLLPYVQAGQNAVTRLSSLLTPGSDGSYQPFSSGGGLPQTSATQQPLTGAPFGLGSTGAPLVRPDVNGPSPAPSMSGGYTPFTPPSQGPNAGSTPGMNGGGPAGATVLMIGPDGSQKQIPRDQVSIWLQRGAKLAGGQ